MSRIGMIVIGLIAATALIVGCTDELDDDNDGLLEPTPAATTAPADTPAATPTATDTPDATGANTQPPEGEIEVNGQVYDLGIGSFRWGAEGSDAVEQEAMGVVVMTEAVRVSAGDDITIRFLEGGLMGDADVEIRDVRLFEAGEPVEEGIDWVAFERPFDAMGLDLGDDAEHTITLPDDLEPGTYVLEIEVESGDDNKATYGVLLEVS
jgi:hypothetical protein